MSLELIKAGKAMFLKSMHWSRIRRKEKRTCFCCSLKLKHCEKKLGICDSCII